MDYFDFQNETLDRNELEELQLERLQKTVERALQLPFYKSRLEEAGIEKAAQIQSLEDLRKIPFTTKSDLRTGYPEGFLAVDKSEVVRIHTSSGTTGKPTVIYHTQNDIDNWADLVARCMAATGADSEDVFQNMTGYGLFTGGLGMHYGAEKIGMSVIPTGSGNTEKQLEMMKDFNTTIVHATPSYLLHLYDKIQESTYSMEDFSLEKAFLGAEFYSKNTSKKIENLYDIDVYNSYGLSEMNGPGVAFDCSYKEGMHIWEDNYIVEVIDPETGELLDEGESGELVLTIINREATPILRYRTHDLTSIIPGECSCGRSHKRISRILGRSDDMLIVNGANMFPSQIESVIMKYPEVGTNYQIHLSKKGSLDQLTVKVELYSKLFNGDTNKLENLKSQIKEDIKNKVLVTPKVELHEPDSLPDQKGKATRVIDKRYQEEK